MRDRRENYPCRPDADPLAEAAAAPSGLAEGKGGEKVGSGVGGGGEERGGGWGRGGGGCARRASQEKGGLRMPAAFGFPGKGGDVLDQGPGPLAGALEGK